MKNIFISYSHKDAGWKETLVSHLRLLERGGFCQLWHDRDIALGRDWFPDIDKAINKAHIAIMLITKNFLDSDFINKEEIPRILKRRKSGKLMAVPLFVKPCAWHLVDWLAGLQGFPTDGRVVAEGSEVDIDKKLADFTAAIAQCLKGNGTGAPFSFIDAAKAAVPLPPGVKTFVFTRLPFRKINLIGRDKELTDLAAQVQTTRRVLLVNGLGGIGKTEVCKTFFMDHYREYAYAGWIDCVSFLKESLVNAFTFVPPGILEETGSLDEKYQKIMEFLQRLQEPALLVFDNLDNPGDEHLPDLTRMPPEVKVIANSRVELPGFEGWRLEFLSENRCRELFYRFYDIERDDESVSRVVARCVRHTLTIELLARTAQNANLRVPALEKLLADKGFNLDEVIKYKVETAWHEVKEPKQFFQHLLTLFDLTGVSQEELEFMKNLSVLPSVYISLEDIKEWLGMGDHEVVLSLIRKGWLRREKGDIYMHPVMGEVTRYKAGPGVKDCERLIESLTRKLKVEPGENPLDKQGYVVFADTLLHYIDETHEKAATLANNLSLRYSDLGQLEKALEFQLKDIEIRDKVLDKNHPSLATSYNNASMIYKDLGQLKKALEIQLQTVDIFEQILDKNHPDLAASYNNLSLIYHDMKDFPTALTYTQKAVSILQGLFPNCHPHLETSLNNLEAIKRQLKKGSAE